MKTVKTILIMLTISTSIFAQATNKRTSAIVLIEFQKTWTEKGIFHQLIKKEYIKRNVLSNTQEITVHARKNGVTVIHAPLIVDKNSVNYKKMPFPSRLLKRFTSGTWKAEFADGVYENTDFVVKGRYAYDATIGSDLVKILTENNIETVFVCGFTTDHCVAVTMESLAREGYKCVMLTDCTATRNKKLQKKAEKGFQTITNAEFVANL